MVDVLQRENLFIAFSKRFLYFEWTISESDVKSGSTLRSPEFNIGGEKHSFLEFTGREYLCLHNPKCIENGSYVTTIFDGWNEPIYSIARKTDSIITSDEIDLIPTNMPSSPKFPIVICGTARASNALLLKDSNASQKETMRDLCLDLQNILDQEIHTDMVLNVDGDSIKAHKLILQARSPVFLKMFDHDSSEAAQNTVVISDIKSATMRKLVSFLYTTTVELENFDEILELYYAADKYGILSLRKACKIQLLGNMDVNNALSLFVLANRHNDGDFKEKVVQFVSANFKTVVTAESLNEMDKDDIILLMCSPNMK